MADLMRVRKAGALRSGSDSRGSTIHLIEPGHYYGGPALCGQQPSIQWSDSLGSRIKECPKCQRLAAMVPGPGNQPQEDAK